MNATHASELEKGVRLQPKETAMTGDSDRLMVMIIPEDGGNTIAAVRSSVPHVKSIRNGRTYFVPVEYSGTFIASVGESKPRSEQIEGALHIQAQADKLAESLGCRSMRIFRCGFFDKTDE